MSHTEHCAARMLHGDGVCECGRCSVRGCANKALSGYGGTCIMCTSPAAAYEAGKVSVLDKVELAAFRMLAEIEHDTWCYTKAHGCNACSGMDELTDTLADLGRPGPAERLKEQRDEQRRAVER